MEIKEKFNELFVKDKRLKIAVIIGLIGVLILAGTEIIPSKSSNNGDSKNETSYQEYIDSLETDTEEILSSIKGAGKCKVMITIKESDESVFAKNSDISSSNGSFSEKHEYVLNDGSNGDEPILLKQSMPKIQGVVIVCEGGDNSVVRESIMSAVTSLFDVSSTKISISKLG